jgi:hypothetical protein
MAENAWIRRRAAMPALAIMLLAAIASPVLAQKKPKDPPGNRGGSGANSLTLTASPNPVRFGRATTISGALNGSGNGGQRITLESRPYPFSGGFSDIRSLTTPANGRYSFSVSPGRHTQYRTTAATSPRVTSSVVLVRVAIRAGMLVSDSTPARGQFVRFSGSAYPAHDGRTVVLRKRAPSGVYRTVARRVLRDAGTARSRYSFRLRVRRSGVYRVRISGDADHVGATTVARRLRIH